MFKLNDSLRLLATAGLALAAFGAQAAYTDVNLVGDDTVLEGVYDSTGDLTWYRDWAVGGQLTQADAITFADAATYGGVSGWRLPTQGEYLAAVPANESAFGIPSSSGPFLVFYASGLDSPGYGKAVARASGSWVPGGIVVDSPQYFALVHDGNVSLAAPVPEPETYALMLAGLGVVGAVSRRQRRVK
jgi:hypothetical protein